MGRRWLACGAVAAGALSCATSSVPPPAHAGDGIPIQSYRSGVAGVHAANPDVKLSVGRDVAQGTAPVLFVDYPAPTPDPAGRDVWCDAESTDWSAALVIAFQVKPEHAVKLSVSFLDRNHVAYTTWVDLTAGVWQPVRIPLDRVRPNPYFQPPDARVGAPLDAREVKALAFAPRDDAPGRLAISAVTVLKIGAGIAFPAPRAAECRSCPAD